MTPRGPTEPCHRCLQPVPVRARRCPHCGDFHKTTANARLFLTILAFAVVFSIIGLAVYVNPPSVDHENTPEPQTREAPKPYKKPPLD